MEIAEVEVDSEILDARLTLFHAVYQLQLDLYDPVVRYVHSLLHNNNTGSRNYATDASSCRSDGCWSMSVTGHSLGGGIASIVGSTLDIPVTYLEDLVLLFD